MKASNNDDITTARYQDSDGIDITQPLIGFAGQASGSVVFYYDVDTTTPRSIPYKIWLVDSASNESNKLSGTIWVSW